LLRLWALGDAIYARRMERRFLALLRLFTLGDVVRGWGTALEYSEYSTDALCFGAACRGCDGEHDDRGAQKRFHRVDPSGTPPRRYFSALRSGLQVRRF
jgi:hypothetical protein